MRVVFLLLVFGFCGVVSAEVLTDFEDLALEAESYWNGSDNSGGFVSGDAWFNNNYSTLYHSWDGFSYSNITDTTTAGMNGQYNAIASGGQGTSANYAVGYVYDTQPRMVLNEQSIVSGLYITNNNYAYYSMLNGDAFADKFGGTSGNDADWFLLTISGRDELGEITGEVEFYLADYRFADNESDYIVDSWEFVDLTGLGLVKSIDFGLTSSDTSSGWMNTPAYFAIDTVAPEPGTFILLGLSVLFVRKNKK